MNPSLRIALPSLLALLPVGLLFAQGPLVPPSTTPAPSMKSLDQIEARPPGNPVVLSVKTSSQAS